MSSRDLENKWNPGFRSMGERSTPAECCSYGSTAHESRTFSHDEPENWPKIRWSDAQSSSMLEEQPLGTSAGTQPTHRSSPKRFCSCWNWGAGAHFATSDCASFSPFLADFAPSPHRLPAPALHSFCSISKSTPLYRICCYVMNYESTILCFK